MIRKDHGRHADTWTGRHWPGEILKAAGEPTRLRLLALLSHGDLTVTDLTDILGQSQPRISRHLKLLAEAALVDRYQEGAWAFFRLSQGGVAVSLAAGCWRPSIRRMRSSRATASGCACSRRSRSDKAQAYFSRNAAEWNAVRRLHVSEAEVEAKLAALIGTEPVDAFLDIDGREDVSGQLFEGFTDARSASTPAATYWRWRGPIWIALASPRLPSAMAISSTCRWS